MWTTSQPHVVFSHSERMLINGIHSILRGLLVDCPRTQAMRNRLHLCIFDDVLPSCMDLAVTPIALPRAKTVVQQSGGGRGERRLSFNQMAQLGSLPVEKRAVCCTQPAVRVAHRPHPPAWAYGSSTSSWHLLPRPSSNLSVESHRVGSHLPGAVAQERAARACE